MQQRQQHKPYNGHDKFLEINAQTKQMRIVEKDKRGRIVCASEFNHFECSVDTMQQSAIAFGYKFHHGTDLISVYKSIGE